MTDGDRACNASKDGTEVRIGRYHNAFLITGDLKDPLVSGGEEVAVSGVHGVMAGLSKARGEEWRKVEVDKEPHAGRVSGSSRSRSISAAK